MTPRHSWMRAELRYALRTAAVGLLVGLICLLAACGGGEDDDDGDGDKRTDPPPCDTRPELCK